MDEAAIEGGAVQDSASAAGGSSPCVRLTGIAKAFAGVTVIRNVDIEFARGEIHGMVGENGAGKSTVGKIIGGYYQRTLGDIEVFGEQVGAWDPPRALTSGIAMMHQELQLVPELTVAQNIFLGLEHNTAGFLKRDEARRLRDIEALAGFDLDPNARAGSLSIADQQKVEIMRALAREAGVIVMDEPTSSLTADEADRLHVIMRRLRERGHTIIYVSHFLDHVLEVCDTITVMRDGEVVRTAPASSETKASLVGAMLGSADAEITYPDKPPAPDRSQGPIVSVRGLNADTGPQDVSLDIWPGEIVGLVGLVGSGRTEIARVLFGADKARSGDVSVNGKPYRNRSPQRSIQAGLVMVPEDRRKQGLVLSQRVRPNISLPHLRDFANGGFLRRNHERSEIERIIDYFGVVPSHIDGEVVNYSGGNQQKVVLGKWIIGEPSVIILDEPSRGVDVGARRRIHEFVVEIAGRGAGVLLISSEIEEVLGLAHRAYMISAGRVIDEIVPDDTTLDAVLWQLFHEQREKQSVGADA